MKRGNIDATGKSVVNAILVSNGGATLGKIKCASFVGDIGNVAYSTGATTTFGSLSTSTGATISDSNCSYGAGGSGPASNGVLIVF